MADSRSGAEATAGKISSQFSWLKRGWQLLSVRLLLVLGVVIFGVVVAIDSLQLATAADMVGPDPVPSRNAFVARQLPAPALENSEAALDFSATYLEFDVETAHRLQHSGLLRPQLTRSRLARAHLFTQIQR